MSSACTFSVVVPTYNRVSGLDECLRGIAALTFPRGQFQVIVVNDGGAEIPAHVKESFHRKLDIQFLEQSNRGPSVARNHGAAHAEGDWLAFIDDDCIPQRGWLSELASAAGIAESKVLGGSVINGVFNNPEAEASQMLFAYLYLYYHCSGKKVSQRPFFTSNNMAVPRSVFNQIGGFEPAMRNAEDRELCARLLAEGVVLTYVPAARIVHNRPMSLREFWYLHTSYGRGGFELYRRQKLRGPETFRPEGVGFYTDMLIYPWRQEPRQDALRLSGLLALSQIANAFGFFSAMRRARAA